MQGALIKYYKLYTNESHIKSKLVILYIILISLYLACRKKYFAPFYVTDHFCDILCGIKKHTSWNLYDSKTSSLTIY